jgi:hypothetical protein
MNHVMTWLREFSAIPIQSLIMAQATFDRRRLNGPEESISPVFMDEVPEKCIPGKPRKRAPSDIRPIC